MIWLTWRQFRLQWLVLVAALGSLAIGLAVTGPGLARRYAESGGATCGAECEALVQAFLTEASGGPVGALYGLGAALMYALPAIVGLFWGAPLIARELETGTHRLAWTQSVTRTRWLAIKLFGIGAVAVVAAALFSVAITWWAGPIDSASQDRLLPEVFGARGIAPVGWAAFAFVVGVTAGIIVRRTVPAMAITLVVVAAAQVAMPMFVREHLAEPTRIDAPLDTSALQSLRLGADGEAQVFGEVGEPGAWVVSNETVTRDGTPFTGPYDESLCGRKAEGGPRACESWIATLELRQVAAYHPASSFWTLQWRETALLLAVAAALSTLCFWHVRRRLT